MKGFMRSHGFTLIEISITVVLIAILAIVAVPTYTNLKKDAEVGATRGGLGAIRGALLIAYAQSSVQNKSPEYPSQIEGSFFVGSSLGVSLGPEGYEEQPELPNIGGIDILGFVAYDESENVPVNKLTNSNTVVHLSDVPASVSQLELAAFSEAGWWYVPSGYPGAGSVGALIPSEQSGSFPDALDW